MDRPRLLDGPTYKVVLGDDSRMYITVNECEGKPFEVFVRLDEADKYEWVVALTTMITRLLREGQSLDVIGKELKEIHGPGTGHYIPGTGEWSPSIVARIGNILIKHEELKNETNTIAEQ